MSRISALFLASAFSAVSSSAPTGLMVDFQLSPSLGVRGANLTLGGPPHFTWITPPCPSAPDAAQSSYRIVVTREGAPVWDSGQITSADSTYVAYAGPQLAASARYTWTVTSFSSACGASDPSAPALFIPHVPEGGWDASAQWLTISAAPAATFAYLRKDIVVPAGTVSAVGSVTGVLEDKLLSAYKLYVDGVLVNIGPGRGEAPVWEGDGLFRPLPFTTLDLTASLPPGPHTLALVVMHTPPQAIMQIVFRAADGTPTIIGTDATWSAFNGDAHRKPGPATHGGSAGTGFLEYIDARGEPVGWTLPGFTPGNGWSPALASPNTPALAAQLHAKMQPPFEVVQLTLSELRPVPVPPAPPTGPVQCGVVPENADLELACADGSPIQGVNFASFGTPTGSCPGHLAKGSCDAATSVSVVTAACVGKTACTVHATNNAFGGDPCYNTVKELAVEVKCPSQPPPPPPSNVSAYVGIFEKEFQGGLRLDVKGGKAGSFVNITCGESLSPTNIVGYTWGWEFGWTFRDGDQTLEQHKYMECRFVSLVFSDEPESFTLSAWQASYPWVETDSHFESDNATLDAVFDLCAFRHDPWLLRSRRPPRPV